MAVKHSPATSLPWPGLIPEPNFAPQDAVYIVHAANAYPKLVEALRKVVSATAKANDPTFGQKIGELEAAALLRELGELQ